MLDDDNKFEFLACNACTREALRYMWTLGNFDWYRCIACGSQQCETAETETDADAEVTL